MSLNINTVTASWTQIYVPLPILGPQFAKPCPNVKAVTLSEPGSVYFVSFIRLTGAKQTRTPAVLP
jgi:hypothetical protein